MQIIRDRAIVEDDFVTLRSDEPLPAAGNLIVNLARWRSDRAALLAHNGALGLRIGTDVQPESLADDLPHFALIAIEFTQFTDGRGYSAARLLRERLGFSGELRATGNVLRDQLLYMHRCGFNAFELAAGKDLGAALDAFSELTVAYQPATDAN